MDREVLFAETLQQIKELAKEQGGYIEEAQVRDAFSGLALEEEQLRLVFDYLAKHKIGVGQPVNPDDYLTPEEKDFLQGYLEDVALLSQCTEQEKRMVTLAVMAGDMKVRSRLIEMYLNDVAQIARLYAGQGAYLEELIGEGNAALTLGAGMLVGLKEPEEAQAMLVKMIMDAMETHIQEIDANDRKESRILDRVNLVMDKARELSHELQRKVTAQELAQETGMPLKSIQNAVRMSGFQIEYIADAETKELEWE